MNIPPLIPRSSQSVWLSCPILQCPHSYSSIFRFPCLSLLWIFRKPLPPSSFGTVSVMACLLGLIYCSIAVLYYILHLGMWCVSFFSTQWCELWYQIVYCFHALLLCQIKKPSSLLGREKILFESRVIMLRKANGESITWEFDFRPHGEHGEIRGQSCCCELVPCPEIGWKAGSLSSWIWWVHQHHVMFTWVTYFLEPCISGDPYMHTHTKCR